MDIGTVVALAAVFIAGAAGLIALASLGVAIWHGLLMRRHDRLSVRPHLSLSSIDARGEDYQLVLSNDGLGPATITRFRLFVDEKPVEFDRLRGPAEQWEQVLKVIKVGVPISYFHISPRNAIRAGKSVAILEIPGSAILDKEARAVVSERLARLGVMFEYESVYGQGFVTAGKAAGSIGGRE